jgi:hypothetical protein
MVPMLNMTLLNEVTLEHDNVHDIPLVLVPITST